MRTLVTRTATLMMLASTHNNLKSGTDGSINIRRNSLQLQKDHQLLAPAPSFF